jgi:hypothetical protein
MNYTELRKEAIKCNYELTKALLEGNADMVEKFNLMLNHYIQEMLDKIQLDSNERTNKKQIRKTL